MLTRLEERKAECGERTRIVGSLLYGGTRERDGLGHRVGVREQEKHDRLDLGRRRQTGIARLARGVPESECAGGLGVRGVIVADRPRHQRHVGPRRRQAPRVRDNGSPHRLARDLALARKDPRGDAVEEIAEVGRRRHDGLTSDGFRPGAAAADVEAAGVWSMTARQTARTSRERGESGSCGVQFPGESGSDQVNRASHAAFSTWRRFGR